MKYYYAISVPPVFDYHLDQDSYRIIRDTLKNLKITHTVDARFDTNYATDPTDMAIIFHVLATEEDLNLIKLKWNEIKITETRFITCRWSNSIRRKIACVFEFFNKYRRR